METARVPALPGARILDPDQFERRGFIVPKSKASTEFLIWSRKEQLKDSWHGVELATLWQACSTRGDDFLQGCILRRSDGSQ